jgi:hypothetical protein
LEGQLKLTREVLAIGKMGALEDLESESADLPTKFTQGSDFGCSWAKKGKYGGSLNVSDTGQLASAERTQ